MYICGTAIAVPDWALGGHLVISACVSVSAECERLRFGDFTNACITHRRNELNGIKWSQPEEDHVGFISSLGLPFKTFSYIHDTRLKGQSFIDPFHRRTLRHPFGGETLLPSPVITLPLVSSLAPQPFG